MNRSGGGRTDRVDGTRGRGAEPRSLRRPWIFRLTALILLIAAPAWAFLAVARTDTATGSTSVIGTTAENATEPGMPAPIAASIDPTGDSLRMTGSLAPPSTTLSELSLALSQLDAGQFAAPGTGVGTNEGSTFDTSGFISRSLFDAQVDAIYTSMESKSEALSEALGTGMLTASGAVTFSGLAGGILTADGNGRLSTTTVAAASIVDDSLDFSQFADAMTLDATTTIDLDINGADLNFDGGTLLIDSSANRIGIGTTQPIMPLTVVGNAGNPQVVATVPGLANTVNTLDVEGSYLYAAGYSSQSLNIIDISEPGSPTIVGALASGLGSIRDVDVVGNYAYVARFSDRRLGIVDVSDPANPTQVGSVFVDGNGFANSVQVSGGYAYVVGTSDRLYIFDVSDPTQPSSKSSVSTGLSNARGVTVSGDYAYIYAQNSAAIAVVDISDPGNPSLENTVTDGALGGTGEGQSIVAAGNRLYHWSGTHNTLNIYDISDPSDPELASTVTITGIGGSAGLSVAGAYVYVAGGSRLGVVDASDADNPVVLASSVIGSALQVAVQGNYAYVVGGYNTTISIVDIGGAEVSNLQAGALAAGLLTVRGHAAFGQTLSVWGGLNVGGSANFESGIAASATSTFRGNVGIGTTSPTAQLHTAGSVRFSNFGAGTLETDANGNLSVSSDETLKDHIEPFTRSLDAILLIEPISFRWRDGTGMDTARAYTGFSAQNVATSIPEAIGTNPDGMLSLSDRPILAAVVNAVKALHARVTGLAETIADLAQSFTTERVQTSELCVDDICVTRDEFAEMVGERALAPTSPSTASKQPASSTSAIASSTDPVDGDGATTKARQADEAQSGDTAMTGPTGESSDRTEANANDESRQSEIELPEGASAGDNDGHSADGTTPDDNAGDRSAEAVSTSAGNEAP